MDWTGQHRPFIVETFIKNETVTTVQWSLCVHFGLGSHYPAPTRNTMDQHWNKIVAIPHKMIRRVLDNLPERFCQCVDNNSQHLTGLILKMK